MPSPNNVLTADSYIQDGLVFQLDGIDYGGIDGQWLDRKQAIVFVKSGNVVYTGHSFIFDSTNRYICNSPVYINTDGSVQISLGGNRISADLFKQEGNRGFAVNTNAYLRSYLTEGRSLTTRIPMNGNLIIEANNLHYIINGKQVVSIYLGYNKITTSNGASIGGTSWVEAGKIAAEIYAIRIYSRQLSNREILINQKIDNARFGLGLDIPDEVLPASRSLSLLEPFELPDESESEQEPTNDNSDER